MVISRRSRTEWIIRHICKGCCARSGVTRKLMDGCEGDLRVMRDDRLGPVAVVRVKIPNRDALGGVFQKIKSGDGDAVEVTKSHRSIPGGMMSRRSHETERALAAQSCMRRFKCRSGRTQSMFVNLWINRRVGVEVTPSVSDPFKVVAGMHPQHCCFTGGFRNAPFPIRMSLLQ